MKRFIEGVDRDQSTLFPERLEDWIGEDNAVRVIDVFVDELDLGGLGFERVEPRETGRPGYHASVLLKLYNCLSPRNSASVISILRPPEP
jgi:transposase